uniref:Uncharacterized protein n=1 Tax=Arundo donax TaxID=35708 RepID=A0A0A9G881_ARUDO
MNSTSRQLSATTASLYLTSLLSLLSLSLAYFQAPVQGIMFFL